MTQERCRLCLSTNNLSPIFTKTAFHKQYSTALSLTTGLQIKPCDGLPQYICKTCTDAVNSALKLRKQSHNSEIELIKTGYRRSLKQNFVNVPTEVKSTHNIAEELVTVPDIEVQVEFDRLSGGDHAYAPSEAESLSDHKTEVDDIKPEKKSTKKDQINYMEFVEGPCDRRRNGHPIKCKLCKLTLKNWRCFLSHVKVHVGFTFVCEYCGKSFRTSTHMKRHLRALHGLERQLKCPKCEYKALDRPQLQVHIRREHTGERPYVCDSCGAAYRSRPALLQHADTHRRVSADVKCVTCARFFKSRRHLARHVYDVHKCKNFNYKCPVCGQTFRNPKYVRVHMKKAHGCAQGEKAIKIKLGVEVE